MNENRQKGITIAGTILVDQNHYIKGFPNEGELIQIEYSNKSFGGCVPNTASNLSLINENQNIHIVGNIGNDVNGNSVLDFFNKYKINHKQLKILDNDTTGNVDVYNNLNNHQRTFFANLGVNKSFGEVPFECNTTHLHIGYLLLMPYFDKIIGKNHTNLSKALSQYQKDGVKISVDIVSESSDRYQNVVIPSLRYINYLIINELEASKIAQIDIYNEKLKISMKKIKEVAIKIMDLGVKDLVVIHSPLFGLIYDGANFEIVNSLKLPKFFIKNSVGAGDGFCSGILYGILNNYSYKDMLRLASCVAAGVLNSETTQSTIKGLDNFYKLEVEYGRITND